MRRWITADWHLGEPRLALMSRPFDSPTEMNDALIANHNKLVSKDDYVYMLGDVCNKDTPEFLSRVDEFNGHKILIRGNHDRGHTTRTLLNYFEMVIEEGQGIDLKIGDYYCHLTHYPSRSTPECFNLVGHIHSSWKVQKNMLNVGVDCNHFRPHDLDYAVDFYFKAISNFYDNDVWVANILANSKHNNRGKPGVYFP